ALLALIIALVSRVPVRMLISAGLVAWAIYVEQLPSWQTVLALSLLCVLFFGARYLWRVVSPFPGLEPQVRVHDWAGLGGQICVVLASILLGGLSSSDTLLAHAGALALFVLAALLYWLGSLSQRAEVLRWCLYTVGLLVSLVVAWEMHTPGITRLDLLAIAPASYLVVVAPFLMRDEVLSDHHRFGQICALLGAALLLLPSLSLSFSNDNLSPTLLLAGESLALFLLGIIARMRTFVLSGAALVIVSAIHALFLPSLAIPPSVALTVIGGTLLALATGLSLARHRLRSAWLRWQ
ncbi:MAG: hypothetical protein J2P36_24825, partial [Ktedonobacteraceae bacterium]|nr:hypothetical protein [Ktedonobacteraceae bacterium]